MPKTKKAKECVHSFPKIAYVGSASGKLMETVYHCSLCPATKAVLTKEVDRIWIETANRLHTLVETGV